MKANILFTRANIYFVCMSFKQSRKLYKLSQLNNPNQITYFMIFLSYLSQSASRVNKSPLESLQKALSYYVELRSFFGSDIYNYNLGRSLIQVGLFHEAVSIFESHLRKMRDQSLVINTMLNLIALFTKTKNKYQNEKY